MLEYSLDRSILRLSLGYQFNDEDKEKILAELFLDLFVKVLGHNFTEYIFNQNSYYLPVGRTEVLDNIIKIISKLLNSENSSYTQIQRNFAKDIISIDKNQKSYFFDIAHKLEEELFDYNIDIEIRNALLEVNYIRNDGFKTDKNILSSSISEITPIILYLKYILKKKDILIIDEPEAHLKSKIPENIS